MGRVDGPQERTRTPDFRGKCTSCTSGMFLPSPRGSNNPSFPAVLQAAGHPTCHRQKTPGHGSFFFEPWNGDRANGSRSPRRKSQHQKIAASCHGDLPTQSSPEGGGVAFVGPRRDRDTFPPKIAALRPQEQKATEHCPPQNLTPSPPPGKSFLPRWHCLSPPPPRNSHRAP